MDFEKLLEDVFSYSDHDGLLKNELVDPLEENNNWKQIFERIYYECRVKKPTVFEQLLALREAHLREMAVIDSNMFISNITNEIKKIILTDDNKRNWKNNNNRAILEERLQEEIQQIALDFIQNNSHLNNPFVIMNDQGSLLIFNDRNENRLREYSQLLIDSHFNKNIRGIRVRNIVRINESNNPPDEIHQWIRNGLNRIKNTITGPMGTTDQKVNSGNILLPANFNEIFENVFVEKYKELQGLLP